MEEKQNDKRVDSYVFKSIIIQYSHDHIYIEEVIDLLLFFYMLAMKHEAFETIKLNLQLFPEQKIHPEVQPQLI